MIPLMKNAFLKEQETKKRLGEFILHADRLSMGEQYFVSSTFIPVGEEPAEKMNRTMIAALEELKTKVNAIAEGK